ncbi:uncharacterized protein V6R79_006413 [Siganus canaliculatus]
MSACPRLLLASSVNAHSLTCLKPVQLIHETDRFRTTDQRRWDKLMMEITGLMFVGFTLSFLQLTAANPVTGNPTVIGSPERIRATAGDNVTVWFHLEPPSDITDWTLELRHNGTIVHVYRHGKVDLQQQDERFTDIHREMSRGSVSVKLTNVTQQDSGEITLSIPNLGKGRVTLVVVDDEKKQDDNEQTRDQTGVRVGAILCPLLSIIAVSAVICVCYSNPRKNPAGRDTAGTFEMNQTQSLYEAVENQNITLEWTFTIRGPLRYYEVFCEHITGPRISVVLHVEQGVQFPDSQDPDFTGQVQFDEEVFREGRLRVHVSRLQTTDSGLYRCEVVTEHGSSSGKCRLSVSAAANETQTLRPGPEGPGPERPGREVRTRTGLYVLLGLTVVLLLLVVAAAAARRNHLNKFITTRRQQKQKQHKQQQHDHLKRVTRGR